MPSTHTNHQDSLVSAHWLAKRIHEPGIRVIDCTTYMVAQPVGPSKILSGKPDHKKAHIHGAVHIDMVDDLSDPNGQYPYTAIDTMQFNHLLARLGIEPTDHVVLYGQSGISTITRAWFIFYLHGQSVSILDGGLANWVASGYETTDEQTTDELNTNLRNTTTQTTSPKNKNATSTAQEASRQREPEVNRIVNREVVQQASQNRDTQLINALSAAQFAGAGGAHYGRPGRIPNSLNLPAKDMIDPATGCFWDIETLAQKVKAAGISLEAPAIHYCGGGIAATTSAFVMHLLGARHWSVYDDSLLDWSNQAHCPMVRD
ncbi:MAG TPA: rhodanese-like domain-containing protein [Orrella sp.]